MMQAVDALTVSVVVDNSSDMLSTRPPHIASELRVLISAGMQELTGEGLCSAHHGLSLAVTARLGARERTVLFDAGPDPYALERNVRRMGLDFGRIEAVVLSHGHFDHSEGLLKAIELIRGTRRGTRFLSISIQAFLSAAGFSSPTGTSCRFRKSLLVPS
jgi:7,8-dihydropterin-6-yl-methyl-4-(beta-D-ribofuranosyl)aminobenzene 5'-phosphate synthase